MAIKHPKHCVDSCGVCDPFAGLVETAEAMACSSRTSSSLGSKDRRKACEIGAQVAGHVYIFIFYILDYKYIYIYFLLYVYI